MKLRLLCESLFIPFDNILLLGINDGLKVIGQSFNNFSEAAYNVGPVEYNEYVERILSVINFQVLERTGYPKFPGLTYKDVMEFGPGVLMILLNNDTFRMYSVAEAAEIIPFLFRVVATPSLSREDLIRLVSIFQINPAVRRREDIRRLTEEIQELPIKRSRLEIEIKEIEQKIQTAHAIFFVRRGKGPTELEKKMELFLRGIREKLIEKGKILVNRNRILEGKGIRFNTLLKNEGELKIYQEMAQILEEEKKLKVREKLIEAEIARLREIEVDKLAALLKERAAAAAKEKTREQLRNERAKERVKAVAAAATATAGRAGKVRPRDTKTPERDSGPGEQPPAPGSRFLKQAIKLLRAKEPRAVQVGPGRIRKKSQKGKKPSMKKKNPTKKKKNTNKN
jgi:hypothetical protein